MGLKKPSFELIDVTLRDGSYAINYQFSTDDQRRIGQALEGAGIRYIEIGHGMGIGASSPENGIALHSDEEYLSSAENDLIHAGYGVFCIPGVAQIEDVDLAAEKGASFIRVGTNIENVDQSYEYIERAKKHGMMVSANYMKSYAVSPAVFAEATRKSEEWGADIVYIVDSAGSMTPNELESYYDAIRNASGLKIGFHGHNNIGLALSNSIFMAELGVDFIDCSLQGLGRSSGNTSLEQFVVCMQKLGYDVPVDARQLIMEGNRLVKPLLPSAGIDPIDIQCGISGFHSSYLKTIFKVSVECQVNPLDLIEEYSRVDQVGMDIELLRSIALTLEHDASVVSTVDFLKYHGSEQG